MQYVLKYTETTLNNITKSCLAIVRKNLFS